MPATCAEAIHLLADRNRTSQFTVMEAALAVLTTSPAVTHLLVRGSLARGTSDRLSDVDLVVGIRESRFAEFVTAHDALVATELGGILPGWPDSIVPAMGGLGYVHLIEHGGRLHQLDLYLAPSKAIGDIATFTRGDIIYTAPAAAKQHEPEPEPAVKAFIAAQLADPPTCRQLIVEALVLSWMIRKRLARGQRFMAYAETHSLTTAARTLIRAALSPKTACFGWYHLEDDLGTTPIGRACLRDLTALIDSPPVPTVDSLNQSLHRILAVARRAAPEAIAPLSLAVDAVLYHLDLD